MSTATGTPLSDDMLDPLVEAEQYPEIGDVLKLCKPIVENFYGAEDRALDFQRKYQRNVHWVKWCGMLAILFAIAVLPLRVAYGPSPATAGASSPNAANSSTEAPSTYRWIRATGRGISVGLRGIYDHLFYVAILEFILAAIALGAVIEGSARSYKENWLLERNRAEQYRMLKYRTMIDPRMWYGQKSLGELGESVRENLHKIETAGPHELWAWIDRDPSPRWPWPAELSVFSAEAL